MMSKKRKGSSRFAALRAKTPFYWLKFVAWFSLVGYVAWLSFIHAVANITWQPNPDLALRFVPDHPLALSRKADELFAESQDEATLTKVEAMAKQSLRGGALNPVAIRLLGYVADTRGDIAKARDLMALSHRVSRRDFGTQLWLIEDAVAQGNKRKALYHYDIAMRTTPSSFPLLFSTLIGALADPEVRRWLAPHIKLAPPYLPQFLSEAINTSQNPADVADVLLKAGPLPDRNEYRALSNALLAQLATKGKFRSFRQYYLSLPGSAPATFGSAEMNKLTVNLKYPLAGWQLVDNPAIGGSFSDPSRAGRSTLAAFAGSGERGELMRKYLFLAPGRYRFSASYTAEESAPESEIRWEMQCVSAVAPVSEWISAAPVAKGRGATVQDFDVDSKCSNQLLVLQVAGGSSQVGTEFTLRSVSIDRR